MFFFRVGHILNVTREIDNFFPGMFDYLNVRVYDDEKTNLLKHWDNTFKYITRAQKTGSKVLVHCKMGVSRSASVVIAYAMKEYNLNFNTALHHVKLRRNCIKPNKSFLQQLETYQGMLDAMKNKEKLQRSKSETNLRSSSAKDGCLLPGSQPTPLIQALNSSAAAASATATDSLSVATGNDSVDSSRVPHIRRPLTRRSAPLSEDRRKSNRRPSSWSPDHVDALVLRPKQQSQSLENLTPERKEEKTKNVLLPCSNGQNYSVSQNQVVYLQENVPSVKLIVSELESNKARNQLARRNRREAAAERDMVAATSAAAAALTLNQSTTKAQQPLTSAAPQQINQLASKSQTNVKQFNHQPHHQHQHNQINNNNHLLCDSPAWTSCPSPPYASSTTSNFSTCTTFFTTTTTTTTEPITSTSSSTISSSAQQSHQLPTTTTIAPHYSHHKSTDIHLCLSDSTAAGRSHPTTTTPSPANVPRRRDIVPPDPIPTTTIITLRHQSLHSSSSSSDHPSSTRPSSSSATTDVTSSHSPRVHHRDMPSRHASWGSGDTRNLPTRNSSWAAFDLRPTSAQPGGIRGSIRSGGASSFAYDRDEIPWHPGTVKRTKQKIESSAVVKRKCAAAPPDPSSTDMSVMPGKTNVFLFSDQRRRPTATNRSHSEEVLPPGTTRILSPSTSSTFQRLSASAPETSTIGCCLATSSKRRSQHSPRTARTLMPQRSLDTTERSASDSSSSTPAGFAATNSYGLVQNLKQNFEACRQDAKKKVKSLPSSPIATHPDKSSPPDRQFNKFSEPLTDQATQEERNVRGLVDRYEVHRSGSTYAVKPRPRSEYISNSSFAGSKPYMISHATIFARTDDFRRPPVPPPIVRNTLGSSSIFGPVGGVSASSVIVPAQLVSGGSNTLSYRKMQQHGKTHPLSRLGLNNPRLSTATYNTM